jgi:Ca2+/Na+ antiporter
MDEIIRYLAQIIALVLLISVIIVDFKTKYAVDKDIQLIIAIIIMFIFITIDEVAGFLLACVAFVIYYKNYIIDKKSVHWNKYNTYISPSHLDNIQSNVFDQYNFKKETIGFNDGFVETNGETYGIQGMNNTMPGYMKDTLYEFQ